MDGIDLAQTGPGAGFCECGGEISGCIKWGEFLD